MEVICNIKKELVKLHSYLRKKHPYNGWNDIVWINPDKNIKELENLIIDKIGWKYENVQRKSWFKPKCGTDGVNQFHTDGWQHYHVEQMLMVAHPKPTQFLICEEKFNRSYYLPDEKLTNILNNGGTIKEFNVGDVVLANITDPHRSNPLSKKRIKRLLLRVLK